jgi:hypothetical protein
MIITVLFSGIFFIFISNDSIINRIEKIYFKIFSFIPIIATGILLIPFWGTVPVVSVCWQLIEPAETIYYQDKNIRIQSSFVGLLGPSRFDIYEKRNMFEKQVYRSFDLQGTFSALKVNYDKDSTRIILYNISAYEDSINVICLKKIK